MTEREQERAAVVASADLIKQASIEEALADYMNGFYKHSSAKMNSAQRQHIVSLVEDARTRAVAFRVMARGAYMGDG